MSILSTELKAYQAANHATDDVSTQGGAIATAGKVEFTDIAATDVVDYVSDGADTRNITTTGRDATGAIVTETKTLNGTTTVNGVQNFERILKVVASAGDASRTFTLKRHTGSTTIATLEPNFTSALRLFYDSSSDPSVQKIRYEKFFLKNTNGSLQLNSAAIKLTADPSSTIRIGCAPSKGDSATITNRLTTPASVTFVDDNVSQSVPTGALAAGEQIGVWAEMTLAAANAAIKSTFTVQLSGTSV
jgi:hypothetical protein